MGRPSVSQKHSSIPSIIAEYIAPSPSRDNICKRQLFRVCCTIPPLFFFLFCYSPYYWLRLVPCLRKRKKKKKVESPVRQTPPPPSDLQFITQSFFISHRDSMPFSSEIYCLPTSKWWSRITSNRGANEKHPENLEKNTQKTGCLVSAQRRGVSTSYETYAGEREREKKTIESSEREREREREEEGEERISTRCTALNPAASSRRANKTKRLFHWQSQED